MGNCTKPPTQPNPQQADNTVALPVATLSLRCSTWQRDSHALFDYESANLLRTQFDFTSPVSIFRDSNDHLHETPTADLVKARKKHILQTLKNVAPSSPSSSA